MKKVKKTGQSEPSKRQVGQAHESMRERKEEKMGRPQNAMARKESTKNMRTIRQLATSNNKRIRKFENLDFLIFKLLLVANCRIARMFLVLLFLAMRIRKRNKTKRKEAAWLEEIGSYYKTWTPGGQSGRGTEPGGILVVRMSLATAQVDDKKERKVQKVNCFYSLGWPTLRASKN